MPVPLSHGSRRARNATFTRAQLPLLAGALFVSAEGAVALPAVASSPPAASGLTVIVVISLLFVGLPWERWPSNAMIGMALGDVVGVALMRFAYFEDLPSVGLLAVFPVMWLAYAFDRWVIALAIASSFFVTLLPLVVSGTTSPTALTLASVLTLPVLLTALAIAVGEAGRQLATTHQRLHRLNRELTRSLRSSTDSELLLRSVFEAAPAALMFYDTDHRLELANDLARRFAAAAGFDLARAPHGGPHVYGADARTPLPVQDQFVPRALRGELVDHETEWIGPPGRRRAILATAHPVTRASGSRWGTLVAAHDVTDLARSLQVKDEFVAAVSHELRTPLTSIRGYLELIAEQIDEPTPFVANAVAVTQRNAERLEARVHELLRASSRSLVLDLRPTDLTELVGQVVSTHRAAADERRLDLTAVEGQPCEAEVDPKRLEQVVENLVSNALKYTPSPGAVRLTTALAGPRDGTDSAQAHSPPTLATITVSDTGVGMTPDEVEQAFTTFWRADQVRRDQIQGFGIGLGIVHDIVAAHQGAIDIASEPGVGTSVTVTLPVRR